MKIILKNIIFQSIILLLTVQTLNLSVNSVDFYKSFSTLATDDNEDYVDSMLEFLVENVFGYSKDTIHDKANIDFASKQQQTPVHIDLKWYPTDFSISYETEITNLTINFVPLNEQFRNLYFKEVPVKPPQTFLA